MMTKKKYGESGIVFPDSAYGKRIGFTKESFDKSDFVFKTTSHIYITKLHPKNIDAIDKLIKTIIRDTNWGVRFVEPTQDIIDLIKPMGFVRIAEWLPNHKEQSVLWTTNNTVTTKTVHVRSIEGVLTDIDVRILEKDNAEKKHKLQS